MDIGLFSTLHEVSLKSWLQILTDRERDWKWVGVCLNAENYQEVILSL